MDELLADLAAEHAELDSFVVAADLTTPTPARGWTIADCVSHLAFFDERAVLALTDPEAFGADSAALLASVVAGEDPSIVRGRSTDADELLDWWRTARARLLAVAADADPGARVPWYGPAMGLRSFVTARLMETWAHGQDVVDAVDAERAATHRLRHVAHIGVGARPFSYAVRGMALPDTPLAVELAAPDGTTWGWGEPGGDLVRGPALDFCLLVTQRRHRDDVGVEAHGAAADEWLDIAQAFAGPAGPGRASGQFRR